MKVILQQDIKGLGKKEDMIECKDGYARNYLLPRGLAVQATPENLGIMSSRKKSESERLKREKEHAVAMADKLNGKIVTIFATAGENGKLFGSITNKDVADAVLEQIGLNIDKKKVVIDEQIKSLGEHKVVAKLYTGVDASFIVLAKEKNS